MELTVLYTFIDDFFKEISNFDIWKKLYSEWSNKRQCAYVREDAYHI